jgi:hypothetical protein
VGAFPAVLTEVRTLLEATTAAERPPRAIVEHTLTNGYAHVLELERERLRIERRLREVLRATGSAGARARVDEAAVLTRLLAEADRELASVRALLSTLRAQAL